MTAKPKSYWRMAFRAGQGGRDDWQPCLRYGVAVLGNPKRPDLSNVPKSEFRTFWRYHPAGGSSGSNQGSHCNFRYRMQEGDVIYVKSGASIVGKGRITGPYEYRPADLVRNSRLSDWAYFRRVRWERDFPPITAEMAPLTLSPKGAVLFTVLRLDGERLEELLAAEKKLRGSSKQEGTTPRRPREPKGRMVKGLTVVEGKRAKREIEFQVRNRAIIAEKKRQSEGKCEVCGFATADQYSDLAHDILIGHHLVPLGGAARTRKTMLDDIAILCPNCHQAMHSTSPPLTVKQLQRKLRFSWD